MVEADDYFDTTTLVDQDQSFQHQDDQSAFVSAPQFQVDRWIGQPSHFYVVSETGRDFADAVKGYSASKGSSSYFSAAMEPDMSHKCHPHPRRRCRSRDSCSPDSCSSHLLNSYSSDPNHLQQMQASSADVGCSIPLAENLAVSSSSSSFNSIFQRTNVHPGPNFEEHNRMAEKGFSPLSYPDSASFKEFSSLLNLEDDQDDACSRDFYASALSPISGKGDPNGGFLQTRGKKRGPRPKVITPLERRQKRLDANDRERQRMGQLNSAFDNLRTLLPKHGNDRELSKFETIQIAKNYIKALNEMLMASSDKNSYHTSNRNRSQQICS